MSEDRALKTSTIEVRLAELPPEQQLIESCPEQASDDCAPCLMALQSSPTETMAAQTIAPEASANNDAVQLERPVWQLPRIYLRLVHQTQEYHRLVFAMRRLDHCQDLLFAMMCGFILMIMFVQLMQHCAESTQSQALANLARDMFGAPGMSNSEALSNLRGTLFLFYSLALVYPMLYMLNQNTAHANAQGLLRSTHLTISDAGIATARMMSLFSFHRRIRPWNTVRTIKHVKPANKRRPAKIQIEFSKGLPIRIDLHKFTSERETRVLFAAIRNYRPDLHDQLEELERALLPESEKTYTELWSKSLLHETERLRLSALPPDATLQNGRFRIVNQLGSGGQGTAYLAEDLVEGKLIVLKEYILPDSRNVHDRRRAITRLEDEARLLGKLQHEQIVKALDVFLEDHRAYLMLEHIDGPPLKNLVAERGAFSEGEVIELAMQMCRVLSYLHGQSPPMVHQDFTPDNLLLTESHILKLVDFNVAKEKENSKTALVVGKHCYMPPEQFRGKACPQSDIYAMGATLHFMLTGSEPEPLTCCHPGDAVTVSAALDNIVARATALDQADRYQNIGELMRDLELLEGERTQS